jgi:chitodextrinase
VVAFLFTGDTARTYPQYLDEATWTTLVAQPGVSYDMTPAGSRDLPVPPSDGLWQATAPAPPPDPEPAAPEPEPAPVPFVPAPSTPAAPADTPPATPPAGTPGE